MPKRYKSKSIEDSNWQLRAQSAERNQATVVTDNEHGAGDNLRAYRGAIGQSLLAEYRARVRADRQRLAIGPGDDQPIAGQHRSEPGDRIALLLLVFPAGQF